MVKTVQRKLIQKLELIARVKGYNIDVENDKVIIKRQGKTIFVVEVTDSGFAITATKPEEDWTEEDMILFEYINTVLMEYTLLKKLKFLENNK